MTVRFKLALTIIATGLVTALLVIGTVLYAFQRFERETTFQRANAFLARVTMNVDDLLELHQRQPAELNTWMRNLLLYEPDSQLYLLDAEGVVLSSTGRVTLAPGFRVALAPVVLAANDAARGGTAYVMGEDPERMANDAVVAARPLRRNIIRADEPVSGYLYLVSHRLALPGLPWEALRSSFAVPALGLILGIVALTTGLAAGMIASVTRPLQRLTAAVAGFSFAATGPADDSGALGPPAGPALPPRTPDEFGQLTGAFEVMLSTLRRQWEALRRLDHFRREGVSNLSHDLRSPLTATVACLETLDDRWAAQADADEDRRLIEVALRNARNAAHLVRALGDLAKLDEPSFRLRSEIVDVGELLADIGVRFAERAAQSGITLGVVHSAPEAPTPFAALDVELFERAIANLIDNALKFCAAGTRIELEARHTGERVQVRVSDTGPGIAAADRPHLFERFYQSRTSVTPAAGDGGKGLGLAIVKRIAELHRAAVDVTDTPGGGTTIVMSLAAVLSLPSDPG
jgi:signal transduction histidine kinase